ncbi:sigma-70 family RNA polymerase sigma factor [Rhodocytophaga aerolata]|uniref:Sigma-70 family RNA polymerase sigma factor n=1 Tax=Rhodocytophaga aerolata TaxID=455078 RepID=A0ABT8R0S5_9BACT|nr:sigma-70 family RNA polymerase sigma factor [Rhodocytophaga aerolata]MDO1444999.1 sigma-70 family RNA polymerase sigma factor [Rhodocytophaga aerolata]
MTIPLQAQSVKTKAVALSNEPDIWKAFKEGDQQAYACIFKCYKDVLYNYGLTLVADEELICDCIQELFIDLWVKREKLSQINSIRYYLLVSFRRLLIAKLEHFRKSSFSFNEAVLYKHLDPTGSADMDLIHEQLLSQQYHKLSATVDHLPKRQKEALYLRYYEKLSYEEVMQLMSLSYKSVRNLVSLAIQTLRKELNKHDFIYSFSLVFSMIF